jgi:mono/diheme cytochrome c family protein
MGNRGTIARPAPGSIALTATWLLGLPVPAPVPAAPEPVAGFVERHCVECHDDATKEGGLDLTAGWPDPATPDGFARWLRIHDRVESGEMPPPKSEKRPDPAETGPFLAALARDLTVAEAARLDAANRTGLRRLTRAEYENTVRDLFDLPGLAVQNGLPADGSAHGFDKNSDALDISHVNLARYVEAADRALDLAIATQPDPPARQTVRLSLAGNYEPNIMLMQGDAVLLRDGAHDPVFPPAGKHAHINQGAHEQLGIFKRGSSVGVFRHEDESWNAYFRKFAALYPGRYRIRASLWSLWWEKGKILPARGVEAARLSVVQFNENGRGGQHPSYVLGYFDAPSLEPRVHEMEVWLNQKETLGFNTASLAPVVLYRVGTWGQVDRTMGFTGPCIVSDWLDIEGPLHEVWPPNAHRLLFGELPIREFRAADQPGVTPPRRRPLKQEIVSTDNKPEPLAGIWTVHSAAPEADLRRLLGNFLPRAFRRPVAAGVVEEYVALAKGRLEAGDSFEAAMRHACRAALCSPDFLYHVEPAGPLDGPGVAARLSYFLWNSMPDGELTALAAEDRLRDPAVRRAQVERLLKDPKSQRFIEDFLGQWLKLRAIAANDPDKKLYPEFSPYLQDSMVAETRAYFRELIEQDLGAAYLVKSDFAMLNEKLAVHYGIPGVSGPAIRRVNLPPGSPRGGFLTQAALLKITANGTTTSPVPRGAFVMERLLGQKPEPPPPNVPAVEPDVQGATTIRELLDQHRADAACAGCHAKIDPPGFALESFDVIGGQRDRYRALEKGDPAPRGSIDPKIGISFKLGPPVDASGRLPDGRTFAGIAEFQDHLAAEPRRLLANLARQFTVYATGRDLAFADRAALRGIVERAEARGGGIRILIHEVVQSDLFLTR